jgi:hypothetical protein
MQLGAANFIVQTILREGTKLWTHKQYFSDEEEARRYFEAIPAPYERRLWRATYEVVELEQPAPIEPLPPEVAT